MELLGLYLSDRERRVVLAGVVEELVALKMFDGVLVDLVDQPHLGYRLKIKTIT